MRKIISFLLVASMVLMCFASTAIAQDTVAYGAVKVSSATTTVGEEVTLNIELDGENALGNYGAFLIFDETELELVDMGAGDHGSICNPDRNMAVGFWITNITEGILFTGTFRALKVGTFEVTVEFDNYSTNTANDIPVIMSATAGTITATCANHQPGGEYKYDETNHWQTCQVEGCGVACGHEEHSGGTATYTEKAVCSVCGQEYGDLLPKATGSARVTSATANKGEEVTVTVELVGENALGNYGAYLIFDETELELVDMGMGDFCAAVNPANKIGVGFSIYDVTEGSLFTATFRPLKLGELDVSVEFDPYSTDTANNVPVEMTVIPGVITSVCAHSQVSDFQTDDTHHWKECLDTECGEQIDYGAHQGGEATCISKAECEICGVEYGDYNAENHKGDTELRGAEIPSCFEEGYTGDTYCLDCDKMIAQGTTIPATGEHTPSADIQFNETHHWYNCETIGCGNRINLELHEGGEATCITKAQCSVCGQSYGDLNTNNHKGETEVRNAVAADCGNDGYTGDTYCLDCGEMIEEGEVIPATGNHTGGTATCCTKAECTVCGNEYGEFDANNHEGETELRNVATGDCGNDGYTGDTYCLGCNQKIAEGNVIPATGNHTGGTATCCSKAECTVCGNEYGEFDANNHEGETEVRNAVPADCGNDGYTGDIYCLGCDAMLAQGRVIPATGNHTGGTATCISKAECTVCGNEYGDENPDNHVGDTEVRGYEPATCCEDGYTGDTYCLDCGEMIEEGEAIPATNAHASTGDYEYDEDNHWKVCDTVGCGALVEEAPHEGGEATCITKAECSVCGATYGDLDANNHKGETEVRGYEPATCCEDGYTGDTYCLDCGEMIEEGEVIPATGEHASTGDYEYDEDNHWKVCDTVGCGALVDKGAHQGGEATCVAKAECEICGAEYGDVDPDNHFGGEATCNKKAVCEGCGEEYGDLDATNHKNTEIRDGDTWCNDCGEMIKEGEPTPPTPTDPAGPGGPLGDASAVGVAGMICLAAAAAAFVLTRKRDK